MVSRRLLLVLALAALLIVGCQQASTQINDTNMSNNSSDMNDDSDMVDEPDTSEETEGPIVIDRGELPEESEYAVIVTGTEGEVIRLDPEAIDPDNDTVSYEFSEPFNAQGVWRTQVGDAGNYLVTVKAYDGVEYTSEQILVRVSKKNLRPTMNCPETITVTETEIIEIDCGISDPEGDEVVTIYRGFMTTNRYRTTYEDAGTHKVTVTSWDKQNVNETVTQIITIIVKDLNRPPRVSFDFGQTIEGVEGDVITVRPVVNDPDGDAIDIDYSDPFSSDGVWRTEIGDAGRYNASVVVSDGENIVKKVFTVDLAVANTAPRFRNLGDVRVDEGEVARLDFDVVDREDDDVQVDISGYMTSRTKDIGYNEADPNGCNSKGCTVEYTVTVTATDGRLTTEETITVFVTDQNRPPIFRVPA